MMVVQEQKDYRREYLEFWIHGVLIPRGVCRVGLRRSASAVRRSSGPCVEFPVATLALHQSSRCKVSLHRSGLACG
ncbi:hypothetical protein NDU88_004564 [Pleurodeles waltl]|uniref:Uncharacterized protein n=1 Tax=Pleurodeles waltl TaxID=8319 RepID=A0AAV7LLQ0_PLEWA|nr:hypothetical protein NDU88_004564 [Pleurodeles waltl]